MATPKAPKASQPKEEVVREFPPIGKYRIRIMRNVKTKAEVLDIREYISGAEFEGFTRRGIRIGEVAQLDLLRDILREVIEQRGSKR